MNHVSDPFLANVPTPLPPENPQDCPQENVMGTFIINGLDKYKYTNTCAYAYSYVFNAVKPV